MSIDFRRLLAVVVLCIPLWFGVAPQASADQAATPVSDSSLSGNGTNADYGVPTSVPSDGNEAGAATASSTPTPTATTATANTVDRPSSNGQLPDYHQYANDPVWGFLPKDMATLVAEGQKFCANTRVQAFLWYSFDADNTESFVYGTALPTMRPLDIQSYSQAQGKFDHDLSQALNALTSNRTPVPSDIPAKAPTLLDMASALGCAHGTKPS